MTKLFIVDLAAGAVHGRQFTKSIFNVEVNTAIDEFEAILLTHRSGKYF